MRHKLNNERINALKYMHGYNKRYMLRRIVGITPTMRSLTGMPACQFSKYIRDRAHLNVGTVGKYMLLS